LSTSNLPLAELLKTRGAVGGAIESRMLSINIGPDRPYGALDSVPGGVGSSRKAIETLRSAIDAQYGSAGRCFIRRLIKVIADDELAFRQRFAEDIDKAHKLLDRHGIDVGSKRNQQVLALCCAAGWLARELRIVPAGWMPPLRVIRALTQSFEGPQQSDPLVRIRAYRQSHQADIVKVSKLKAPLSPDEFVKAAGFLRRKDGETELLVPAPRFQRAFPDHQALMRQLRASGRARTEGGARTKLTIKAPKAVCRSGRVYCISVHEKSVSAP
jgi:hypothetical protein